MLAWVNASKCQSRVYVVNVKFISLIELMN